VRRKLLLEIAGTTPPADILAATLSAAPQARL
jgi:hypothetical protein